jgi:RAQPRD family integrative conjugative element protein
MRTIILFHVFVLGLASPLAHADADAERETLARIIYELDVLEPLLAEAKATADPDARIRFRYDWLKKDLERIRQGIQQHIDAPRAELRAMAPLRGDYRR